MKSKFFFFSYFKYSSPAVYMQSISKTRNLTIFVYSPKYPIYPNMSFTASVCVSQRQKKSSYLQYDLQGLELRVERIESDWYRAITWAFVVPALYKLVKEIPCCFLSWWDGGPYCTMWGLLHLHHLIHMWGSLQHYHFLCTERERKRRIIRNMCICTIAYCGMDDGSYPERDVLDISWVMECHLITSSDLFSDSLRAALQEFRSGPSF